MNHNRRNFCVFSAAAAASMATGNLSGASANIGQFLSQEKAKPNVCAFIKFIQELSFDELAETMARQGFQGIEATIRKNGLIEPSDVPEKLPQLVKALKKQDVEITIMTTGINTVDAESENVLKTAADLGIKRYRTNYYRYDLKKPVLGQLDAFRSVAEELAKLNRKIGITGLYQNHAGAKYLGSTMWDLQRLLANTNPDELGVAFDIRHAIASAGQSWPVFWNLIESKVKALYVKDFRWDGLNAVNVPLGDGVLDPKFFKTIRATNIDVPVSLHVEYLKKDGLKKNVDALETDLKKLHKLLGIN